MSVRVDETGQEYFATKINRTGASIRQFPDFFVSTNMYYSVARDRNGFNDSVHIIKGHNFSIDKSQIQMGHHQFPQPPVPGSKFLSVSRL
jgi:hypothetical protein